MLDDTDDIHPLFHGAPKGLEFRKLRKRLVQQVREAIDTYGMAKAGRPLAGLPVGRQGQLYAARHPARAEMARPACRWSFWPATSTRASRAFRRPYCRNF
jgi:hypothetical protein